MNIMNLGISTGKNIEVYGEPVPGPKVQLNLRPAL